MFNIPHSTKVIVFTQAVDMRKGFNGLFALVGEELGADPLSGWLFVFSNKSRNRVKILYWESSGFCLWQKRLERERFKWPRQSDEAVITLTGQQLNWLLDGYDLRYLRPHQALGYKTVL